MKTKQTTAGVLDGIVRPIRTLIVDDSKLLLTCLCDLLATQENLQVVGTAANGSEALIQADALKPDLILMDINMPVMNGLQATLQLRTRLPDTRIIIMTMEDPVRARAAARAHGAQGFIQKDLLVTNLTAEIQRVLRLKNTSAESNLRENAAFAS